MTFGPVGSTPAQTTALSALTAGANYASLDDAINAARIHAQKQGFSYKVSHRNKNRAVLKCSGSKCQAYTRLFFRRSVNTTLSESLRMTIHAKGLSKLP